MEQLIKGVLSVGAGLAPKDLTRLRGDRGSVPANGLAIRLHRQLLEIGGETDKSLGVGEDDVALRGEEVVVPDVQHPLDDRHVRLERSSTEVLVHGVETG